MTYEHRLVALLVFMAGMVAYDYKKNPPGQRYRLGNYGFILVAGVVGAIFGLCVDLCTSRISVDYFIHGKGIAFDNSFPLQVMLLGLKAGFSAGAVAGCFYVIANANKRYVYPLYPYLLLPPIMAGFVGAFLGCIQFQSGWIVQKDVIALLDWYRAKYFTTVWMVHLGVYAGGLLGVLIACLAIRLHTRRFR